MKTTDKFKEIIENYLTKTKVVEEPTFQAKLDNPDRSMKDCINFILTKVKATGENAFADQEIFDMAVEYWTKDKIEDKEIGKHPNVKVAHKYKAKTAKPKSTKKLKVVKPKTPEQLLKEKQEARLARLKAKPQNQIENQVSMF
jgi:hypothetical protein